MHNDKYLIMQISTVKYDNLNGYGKILTANHESQRKIRTLNYITNSIIIGREKKRKRARKEEKIY